MRLPDPNVSYAELIGTSAHRNANLPDLPAVLNNLEALRAAAVGHEHVDQGVADEARTHAAGETPQTPMISPNSRRSG